MMLDVHCIMAYCHCVLYRYAWYGHVFCHVSGQFVSTDGCVTRSSTGSGRRRHVTPSLRHDDGRSGSSRRGRRHAVVGGDGAVDRRTAATSPWHVRTTDEWPKSAVTPRRRRSRRRHDARRDGRRRRRPYTGHPRRVMSLL